jgi:short-subunit dehydrogenase
MPDSSLALITGASSGIGATFARRLAANGYRLILVARRLDRLESLASELGNAEVLQADLAEESGLQLVEKRILAAPDLTLLVNNAGFGSMGRFFEIPVDSQDRMHRLHVIATMRLTHAALSGMVPRGAGAIINVSSVAGFGQNPGSISYCATKAWMNSFTEGLDIELKTAQSPVKVQALCPGFTITEFQDVIGMERRRIPNRLWMKAEDVVDASLKGLARDELIVVPGRFYKVIRRLQSWAPRSLRVAVTLRFWRSARPHEAGESAVR